MAIALLTRLPVIYWLPKHWSNKHQGLSVLWYPVVGLLLSMLLCSLFFFLPLFVSPLISSLFIVTTWGLLTGFLHLDGLADSVDAAFASHKLKDGPNKRQKILAVFKDPAVGAMAAIALILVIFFKILLLSELINHLPLVLILSLVLSRTAVLLLMVTTPYVRAGGLGEMPAKYVPIVLAFFVVAVVVVFILVLIPITKGIVLIICMAALFFIWRQFWLSRIGGFVGDCAGALIEMGEVLVLLALYLMMGE